MQSCEEEMSVDSYEKPQPTSSISFTDIDDNPPYIPPPGHSPLQLMVQPGLIEKANDIQSC